MAVAVPIYRGGMWLTVFATALLVAFLRGLGWNYVCIFIPLWIGNMILMGGVIRANKLAQNDFTSMEGMRNLVRKSFEFSKTLGWLAEVWAILVLIIWSGADGFMIFFDEKFSSRKSKIAIFVLVSFVNMTIWTLVFINGADGFWALMIKFYK